MAKVQLSVVRDDHDRVIDFLHSAGIMELEPAQAGDQPHYQPESHAEYWQSNVKFALDFIRTFVEPAPKSFLEKLQGAKITVDEDQIQELVNRFDYKQTIKELEELDRQYNDTKNRITQSKKERGFLSDWLNLPEIADPEQKHVTFRVGTVPIAQKEEFRSEWRGLGKTELVEVNETNKESHLVLAYVKGLEESVHDLLERYGFKAADIQFGAHISIAERSAELDAALEEDEKRLALIETKIQAYEPTLPDFEVLFDYLTWKKDQDEASRMGLATEQTVSLVGWIPQEVLPEIEAGIQKITYKYLLEPVEIGEDEDIPVVLRNTAPITPFESVTEIYGAPQYDEPDPTFYLAPFFILYFALCLTDAGYGVLLALLAYVALRVMKPKGGAKKLMTLMMFGGVATFIIGALFGGWFGITIADLPDGAIKSALLSIRLIDPVQNPMTVLVLSFILGFIQMVVGNLVDLAWKVRHGQAKEGLLSSGLWALFLLLIGFWIATQAGVLPESTKQPALYLVLAGAAAMVLTQGREKKGIFMKLLAGVGSLYGLVGYLSDILSYSRLLALGLSTGIIAMVVNLVADLFAGMVPSFIGWLVWLLIIVGGHLFNLAINVLGAFIHSGRLQYVEYFPKFLVGGGRKFKPLVKTAKYTTAP
jgi:V/A-type H+-transporting ATPase subunit I